MAAQADRRLRIADINSDGLVLSDGSVGTFVIKHPKKMWQIGDEVEVRHPDYPRGKARASSVTNLTQDEEVSAFFKNSKDENESESSAADGPVPVTKYQGFEKEHKIYEKDGRYIMLDDGSKWYMGFSQNFQLDWEKGERVVPNRGVSADKRNSQGGSSPAKLCKMINKDRNNDLLSATYIEE